MSQNENKIREQIDVKFEKAKDDVIEALSNENHQIEANICMDREDGSIYVFWDCGNTCVNDILIKKMRGESFWHDCAECPLCEDSIEVISENIGTDAEDMTIEELKEICLSFDGWFDSDEENLQKTVDEVRHQCYVENYFEDR